MLNSLLFIAAHQFGDLQFYPTYKRLIKNQWKSYEELREEQEKQLRYLIIFSYINVPYYHKLFDALKLTPDDIRTIEDLEKLPILTKEVIKSNWGDFKPINLSRMRYYKNATGGSTGTPFNYRLHKFDRFLSGAMLYRGWGYAGYKLSDKMVFLAGAPLTTGVKASLSKKVIEMARNIKLLSSYGMDENDMGKYVKVINTFKPKFIWGYASSIYFFSRWIEGKGLKIHRPLAVFTTSEKLYPDMRAKIEDIFSCKVYDTYGLNDGGISAFECPENSGLHIDTERGIMEVVDENGIQLSNGEGRILATSLYNFAQPFIRYDTGDLGHIASYKCACGRGLRLLKELIGKAFDVLITPEGKVIHGCFFTNAILKSCSGIKEYQVVQDKIDKITIKIVPERDFEEKQLEKLRDILKKKSDSWDVEFDFVEKNERTGAGKYRFVVSKIQEM